jgi:hypothetical protein
MILRFMTAGAAMAVSAVGLSACSDGGSPHAPAIEPFLWTDKPAYCAFLPSGTKFDLNDRSTWEFVLITDPQPGVPLPESPAVMKVGGEQATLKLAPDAPGADRRTWVYRNEGGQLEVELKFEHAIDTMGGPTGGPQSATLRVRSPARGPVTEVRGGCGL